jgi:membrane associated rhomboid family serine protease
MRIPQTWTSARATLAIAAVTAVAWLLAALAGANDHAALWGGFIPARITSGIGDGALAPVWLTPLTCTLVHDGFAHVAFNLLFLLFCGRSIEPIVGSRGIVALYLAGAYGAAAAAYLIAPTSIIPLVGASGAISAVLGASAMLLGKYRVKTASPVLGLWLHVLWLAAAWVGLQLAIGFTFTSEGIGPVSVAAHIGGFLVGLALARPLLLLKWRGA